MKIEIHDQTDENPKTMYIGLDSIVEFEDEGRKYKAHLGSTIKIWEVGENSDIHVHLKMEEEVAEAVNKLKEYIEEKEEKEDYDPTPWCSGCGAMKKKHCGCGPIADND